MEYNFRHYSTRWQISNSINVIPNIFFFISTKIRPVHMKVTTQTQTDRVMNKPLAVGKSRRFSLKKSLYYTEFKKNHDKYTGREQIESEMTASFRRTSQNKIRVGLLHVFYFQKLNSRIYIYIYIYIYIFKIRPIIRILFPKIKCTYIYLKLYVALRRSK